MTQHPEDLIFIHSNFHILYRTTLEYFEGETKMWDIARDKLDSFEDAKVLEVIIYPRINQRWKNYVY